MQYSMKLQQWKAIVDLAVYDQLAKVLSAKMFFYYQSIVLYGILVVTYALFELP